MSDDFSDPVTEWQAMLQRGSKSIGETKSEPKREPTDEERSAEVSAEIDRLMGRKSAAAWEPGGTPAALPPPASPPPPPEPEPGATFTPPPALPAAPSFPPPEPEPSAASFPWTPEADRMREASAKNAPPPPRVVAGDILPSFESVMEKAKALDADALPYAVAAVISDVARAHFSNVEEDRALSEISERTKIGVRVLRADLKSAKGAPSTETLPANEATLGWRRFLVLDDEGETKNIVANVAIVLRYHPDCAGVLALDDFTKLVMLVRRPPWLAASDEEFERRPITDEDVRAATIWLQTTTDAPQCPSHVVLEGMQATAECTRYHPIKEFLRDCADAWDRTPRISGLFVDYFNADIVDPEANPNTDKIDQGILAYYRAIGARALIGAVARIIEPGCKNDTMPNLFGDQGIGKSSAVEALFEPWHTDDLSEMGSKDSQVQIAGVWGVEVGEMVAARRDTDRTKAFISRRVDRYRPPYGKTPIVQPRQCAFWGTTNRDVFLFDETGNRRSWGVNCGLIDVARLKADRIQLWGEAVHRYRAGEKYWLHEPELIKTAADLQASFIEQDAWHDTIAAYVAGKAKVTVDELLGANCVGIMLQDRTQAEVNRVAKVLRRLGWERRQRRVNGERKWFYIPPRTVTANSTSGASGDGVVT